MTCQLILACIHLLEEHGELPIGRLARLLDAPADQLRAEIAAFNDVEASGLVADPLFEIEAANDEPEEGGDPAPSPADLVRFSHGMTGSDLGLRHLDASVLGPLQVAGHQLASVEPENLELAAALDTLSSVILGGAVGSSHFRNRQAAFWRDAAIGCRAVRITYSNTWVPKVRTRVVHPYQVMSTARGFEIDAGPLDGAGAPRTFLLDRVLDHQTTNEIFARPPGIAEILTAHRKLTRVTGYTPHCGMWAIRHWSERIEEILVDSSGVAFAAWLLPPVQPRVALMLLLAGPEADVDDPELSAGRAARAKELLAHHGL